MSEPKRADALRGPFVSEDELLARAVISPDIPESELRTRLILMINTILADAMQRGALVDQDTSMISTNSSRASSRPQKHKERLNYRGARREQCFQGPADLYQAPSDCGQGGFFEGDVIYEEKVPRTISRTG